MILRGLGLKAGCGACNPPRVQLAYWLAAPIFERSLITRLHFLKASQKALFRVFLMLCDGPESLAFCCIATSFGYALAVQCFPSLVLWTLTQTSSHTPTQRLQLWNSLWSLGSHVPSRYSVHVTLVFMMSSPWFMACSGAIRRAQLLRQYCR